MEVKNYESNINGIDIVVYDIPGLCDDLEEEGNDYKYLELMRSKVNKVDSMWFVSRLDDTRVTRDEKEGIKLISECFTSKIWEQAIIVFTFAGKISSEEYSYALKKRTELIRNEISKYADVQIANNIPSIAVDNKNKLTPDGKKWLGKLFTQVYARLSEQDVIPFLMSTVDRIQKPKKEPEVVYRTRTVYAPSPSEQSIDAKPTSPSIKDKIELDNIDLETINNKNDRVLKFMATGAFIGATIGSAAGPVGTVVGGAVGAGVGVVASGIADVTDTLAKEGKKFFQKIFGRR